VCYTTAATPFTDKDALSSTSTLSASSKYDEGTFELLTILAPAGPNVLKWDNNTYDMTKSKMQPGPNNEYMRVLAGMMRSHALGNDICLVGSKGSGKTILANEFGLQLGYDIEVLCCYRGKNQLLLNLH
jgi:hypothetical protein